MGEALIIRSGGGNYSGGWIPKTELITQNQDYIVPEAKGQQFSVRIFGGGGGSLGYTVSGMKGGNCGGGGSGNMNYAVLTLNEGEIIPIVIGNIVSSFATYNSNGETTSFGNYLSATGGEKGIDGHGGNGGAGGGCGGNGNTQTGYYGGNGTYGGGGGSKIYYNGSGGNGGIYGGGGAGGYYSSRDSDTGKPGISLGGWGNGGGGNRNIGMPGESNGNKWSNMNNAMALDSVYPEDGLNTINIASKIDFAGCGLNGGLFGGGGGYGGNGGKGNCRIYDRYYRIGGGGGGGYGARGGSGGSSGSGSSGGGGGGYGGNGGNAINNMGGGGGGYGIDQYGCGCGGEFGAPKPGICIISYMQRVQS